MTEQTLNGGAVNGHAPAHAARFLSAVTILPADAGPVSPLPRQEPSLTEPPSEIQGEQQPSWWQRLDGDTIIRIVAAAAVLTVAAIAAVVSYSHIFDLASAHHESGTAARLLPVSVDGLIAAASLALLHAARNRLRAPGIAYLMLWLGVGATVAANVEYGLPAGWLSAVIAAWPAVAFVGSVEMALTLARNERRAADGGEGDGMRERFRWRLWRLAWVARDGVASVPDDGISDEAEGAVSEHDDELVMTASPSPAETVTETVTPPAAMLRKTARKTVTRKPQRTVTAAARVDAELALNPARSNAEIALAAKASESTVERRRRAVRKA